jgi:large subunit ribosomal protein L2
MTKVIKVNPTSAGRRFRVKLSREGLYKGRPHKALLKVASKSGGRNNQGRITVRHHGGGHKQLLRHIDFKRDKLNIVGRIKRIEYDPKRTGHIALVVYKDGEFRYILAPQGLSIGDEVMSGDQASIKPGHCLPIRNIPLGTVIHSIELKPGTKGQLARSAGSFATLVAREGSYATIRLPSSETHKVHVECKASIGAVSNPKHDLQVLGKAGVARWLNRRPTVRGVAMNPVDHPLGGGEGKSSGGRHPTSFTGKKECKTRNNKRTDRFIITRRKKKNKKS